MLIYRDKTETKPEYLMRKCVIKTAKIVFASFSNWSSAEQSCFFSQSESGEVRGNGEVFLIRQKLEWI